MNNKIMGDTKISELMHSDQNKDELIHGGPGSGRYPKGSTGNGENKKSIDVSGSLKSVSNLANEVAKIPVKKGQTIRGTYPEMTNQELQEKVNRMQLEQRYSDLKGDTKYVASGGEKTREILQTIGSITAIAGSLYVVGKPIFKLMSKKIKKKKGGV